MEADTVVQIPGSYGLLSITGCKTMQIKHNTHKQDVFHQLHSKSYFQLQSVISTIVSAVSLGSTIR